MGDDFLKEVESLVENNKELIKRLEDEKKLLENLFLDNRIPDEFKRELLSPYNALAEVIEKRVDIYKSFKKGKKIPHLIGLLYNESQQKYISSILKNLKALSKRRDISIICFVLGNVNIDEGMVDGLVVNANSITHCTALLPKYIFNIGQYSKPENTNKVKQMYMLYNSVVVNPVNVFNQAVVFDILSSVQAIKKCILPISTFSPSIILEYLSNSNSVFLLPERGTYNNSAVRIEKLPENKRNNCCIETGGNKQYCDEKNLFVNIKKMITNKKYIAAQGVKTLLWNCAPLEARIYVQKGFTGKWNVTEMIAKNEIFLKDSIYKDTVDELERILLDIMPNKVESIIQNLENISLLICSYMDYYLLNLGSCTLDFIIDEEGTPYLISFGGWDQKEYLFKLNGKHLWDKYITNAIDYLFYLKYSQRQGD